MNRIFCMLLLFDFILRSIFLRTVVRVWTDRSPNVGILRYVFWLSLAPCLVAFCEFLNRKQTICGR
jgi:hypothetical protein